MIEISNISAHCLRCRIKIWFILSLGRGDDVYGPGSLYFIATRFCFRSNEGLLVSPLLFCIVQVNPEKRINAFLVHLEEA